MQGQRDKLLGVVFRDEVGQRVGSVFAQQAVDLCRLRALVLAQVGSESAHDDTVFHHRRLAGERLVCRTRFINELLR